jgi:hypothetical protein
MTDFEVLLRQALSPVEPPELLSERLERALSGITDAAAGELEGWEMASIGDPRQWPQVPRVAAAAAIGTAAGAALIVLRVRAQQRKRSPDPLKAAEETVRALASETRKLLDR